MMIDSIAKTIVRILVFSMYCVLVGGDHEKLANQNARFDGWYNNLDHPQWGSPGQGMSRNSAPSYEDGIHKAGKDVLPNPRKLSKLFFRGESGVLSSVGRSVLFAFFGQHIGDDMADSRRVMCPNEYLNVEIPLDDSENASSLDISERMLPIYRSKYLPNAGGGFGDAPRTLVNEATSWLDGSVIYGNSVSWAEQLRSYSDGKLKDQDEKPGFPTRNRHELPLYNPIVSSTRPLKPRKPTEIFSFGNPRGNENPFLMTIGILWFRYHNYLASQLQAKHSNLSDEEAFHTARRWTVGIYQNIVAYEWLPLLTGESLPPYPGYHSHLDPSIAVEFSVAAMRLGHSLVPNGVILRHNNCSAIDPLPEIFGACEGEPALRICNTFWQLQDAIVQEGIEPIVLGMTSQRAEKADNIVVDDLAEFLYGPLKRSRMDLETVTIERGRDAGLSSFNNARVAYGLQPIRNFSELNPDLPMDLVLKLEKVYNDTDLIELYVGGMLEGRNDSTGPLFTRIIMDQFSRTRDSDRFWFENEENGIFNRTEIEEIRNTTMRDVIAAVTSLEANDLQENVFSVAGSICEPNETPIRFNKPCSANTGIDFFSDYWGRFAGIIILLFLCPAVSFFVMCVIAWRWQYHTALIKKKAADRVSRKASSRVRRFDRNSRDQVFSAFEVEGKNKSRRVVIALDGSCIQLLSVTGSLLRAVCVKQFKKSYFFLSTNKKRDLMVIRIPKEYDIVLRFQTFDDRVAFLARVKDFMAFNEVQTETFEIDESSLKIEAVTKEVRQELLEAFFRRVFAEVLQLKETTVQKTKTRTMDIVDCELTQVEVAETLGMKADSLFVQQIFQLADVDNSGYLSFREFADLIILLMNGSPEQKAKMLFDMYDIDKSGEINRDEAGAMIRSFLEMAGVKLKAEEISTAVETIFRETGIENKPSITLEDFQYVMLKEHRDSFAKAQLSLPGVTKSVRRKALSAVASSQKNRLASESSGDGTLRKRTSHGDIGAKESRLASESSGDGTLRKRTLNGDTGTKESFSKSLDVVYSDAVAEEEEKTLFRRWWKQAKRSIENYRRHIFCMVIFYSVTIALMVERATYYAFGAEHIGIRRVTEWGIIISRSTAAAISFHFSFILLTMCRNLITFCRETFLNNFIPFDAAIAFHKHIAYVALVESVLHTLGHLSNFYHFSVHPLPVLACLFPTVLVDDGSDLPPAITWWLFQTITGITGLLLVLILSIIYVFAMQFSRRFCFRAFWITHHLYSLLYVLIILHGSMGIVQAPAFHFYLIVPVVIFLIDKLITISRSKVKISVIKAEPLPSDVLNLVFKRPTAFDYKSGQWVRIACLPLGTNEYHPFTLTSAPHEGYLSLHIRSVGPWTTNLRNTYETAIAGGSELPMLYLDGPFGEGHQDWYKYEVSVLVGAGIGVTPFASIIKDIVNRSTSKKGFQMTCKKVYFIWVTRTQRHFEWLTDIIRELEETKGGDLVSTHIYITQFANRFDLRTTMLYICERYFQKVASKSMFTGLKAETHFGRPQFEHFLDSLQVEHHTVRTIGVFSCGPPGLTNGVEEACTNLNKFHKARFNHFYENF